MDKKILEEINAIQRRCRGPLAAGAREAIDKLLADQKFVEARALDIKSRKGCGYDFNKTIAAGPLDGQDHAYTCPNCGVIGVYVAPLYEKAK